MTATDGLYIGLMTGTSVDAIDAALIERKGSDITLRATLATPIASELKRAISRLFVPGNNEIDQLCTVDIELARCYAQSVDKLLHLASLPASAIKAIGSHGQTIRHRPYGAPKAQFEPHHKHPFSMQIGDPNTIAALTGITTVADFRRKDIALGGQGAPLAPAFHQILASHIPKPCAILNIGGISNISVIDNSVTGFDIGPGNALMDAWYQQHQQGDYDKNGHWASTGDINDTLLNDLMAHEYFLIPPPKSTGKEVFTLAWLKETLAKQTHNITNQDVQRTLLELTAKSISQALKKQSELDKLYVCGGGAHNSALMQRLQERLPNVVVTTTSDLGIDPDWVEAAAFAWLASQTIAKQAGNLTDVTGANHQAILGGIYQP